MNFYNKKLTLVSKPGSDSMQRILRHTKSLTNAFLLLIAMQQVAFAQYKESDFISYTVKEGLSSNYVNCLQQDDWGYMWVGTSIGLNRFDGYSFKSFYQGTSTMPLPSSIIRKLKIFGPGQLGIITTRGFQVLDTKNYSLRNYFIPDTTSFSSYR